MSSSTAFWLDGSLASALPLPDRGLDFGDGLFETLLLRHGEPLFVELHMQRLKRGLELLGFPDCLDRVASELAQSAAATAGRGWPWSALRLTITRGAGPRGYAAPPHPRPRVVITATQLERDCARQSQAARLGVARIRWAAQPALAGIKHLNRLEQVLAANECRSLGFDELVMLAQSGHAVSVTAGNLFLLREGQLLTPVLRDSGIAGTRRRLVMERWAPAIGLRAVECDLNLADVEAADEVFYSSSLLGIRPVASLGARRWAQHGVCDALHQQYLSELP